MKTLLRAVSAPALILLPGILAAQMYTQTVKGVVLDKGVKTPLIGATIVLLDSEPAKGAFSDANGFFVVTGVPVGKRSFKVTYLGYKTAYLNNIEVNSGKETDLTIEMEEDFMVGKEVEIVAKAEKQKPLNEMATVSARTFSVEETQRFAAAVNDPARMASAYAGVMVGDDGNNTIIIRGNAPNGLLWRMEGVDIPNPNHFSSVGTSGGGISILSAQLLSNSDFMTGAFAAEYGNALSGVFDLRLRKGNSRKYEYTFQAGVLGIDAAAEGPIRLKNGQNGSFLANYRYSTLSLLEKIGVGIGPGSTDFQDLSFNVWLPAGNIGQFSLFGLGGLSSQNASGITDSLLWEAEPDKRYTYDFRANSGVVGLTHSKAWDKTFLKNVVAVSSTQNGYDESEFQPDYIARQNWNENHYMTTYTVSSVLSHKFNAHHYIRAGAYVKHMDFRFKQLEWDDKQEYLEKKIDTQGEGQTLDAFAQWQFRPNERFTFNAGLHSVTLFLNNKTTLEPRLAIKYQRNERQSFSAAYGLHSQIQPLALYYAQAQDAQGQPLFVNRNLANTKAHHFVLGFDQSLGRNVHVKVETYYQHLFDAPVRADVSDAFSMLNNYSGFVFYPLSNEGIGRNFGAELTLEKFLTDGVYFLLSSAVFQSEYQGSDGVWNPTQFANRFANSLLAGKEWAWKNNRSFGINLKLTANGGNRITPIDLAASAEAGETVWDESRMFALQAPAYFRLDVGLRLKRNFERMTTTLSLDLQNATNRQNVFSQYYDKDSLEVKYIYQAGLIPVLSYKIQF